MSDQNADPSSSPPSPQPEQPEQPNQPEQAELIAPGELAMPSPPSPPDSPNLESIESPAKVMRIGSMVKQLLDECGPRPSMNGRERMAEIYGHRWRHSARCRPISRRSCQLAPPFPDGGADEAELRGRPSSSAGWKGCSTGYRPPCSAAAGCRQQLE
jgi:hypothetical protein